MKTWMDNHYTIVQFLLIPAAVFLLNLLLVNRPKEEAWIAAHPRIHALLSIADASGVNPWRLLPSLIAFVQSFKKTRMPPTIMLLILCMLAMLPSCVAQNQACSEQAETAIEQAFISEVFFTCSSYMKYRNEDWRKECPQYPAIAAKYEDQRRNWIRCR